MKQVAILGLGAVGASIAAQFTDHHYPITVLCDDKRKEKYQKNAFKINSKPYYFHYKTNREIKTIPDLILISVKYHQLREALQQLEGLVKENTIILSLLNGVDSEEIIAEQFGSHFIIPAFIYNIDATKSDNKITYQNSGVIVFGEKNGQESKKIKKVKSIFEEGGINYEATDQIMNRMWWKFMVNMGVNQTTAILKAPYRIIQEVSYARELVSAAMQEVIKIAKACQVDLTENEINHVFDILKDFDPDGKTSMLQDMEAHRKTEVEMFSGKLCEMGKKYGISTPVNYMFFNLIKAMEEINEQH